MTPLPSAIKVRIFLGACAAWLAAGAWLVGCVVAEAPLRMTVGAVLAVLLLGVAVGFVKHDMEMDLLRSRARPTVDPSEDLFSK